MVSTFLTKLDKMLELNKFKTFPSKKKNLNLNDSIKRI